MAKASLCHILFFLTYVKKIRLFEILLHKNLCAYTKYPTFASQFVRIDFFLFIRLVVNRLR